MPDLATHLTKEMANIENISDPDIICNKIIDTYLSGICKFSYGHKPNRKISPIKSWVSPAILASIERRCYLYKLKLCNPSQENSVCFYPLGLRAWDDVFTLEYEKHHLTHKYRNALNTVIWKAQKQYIQEQLMQHKNDTKQLWKILSTHAIGKVSKSSLSSYFLHNIEKHSEIAEIHFSVQ